ncbi:MAG: 2-oxoacid:acceptor oxidoreductase subunit alpha [Candidatus Omnitrophica bacterium]|jgi:2-oxoglutarate ferredoxin oxidoreductase subunit alpha|nr:2-oxoacid:acceptor oxidoreductase subunit alpha [Candidatus Omnitrophota bacterium]
MFSELTIKIAGEAGQGMQTVGLNLCRLFKCIGFYVFANQDYMSRVRGGNNFFQLRIANKPLYALRKNSDIIVALDEPSVGMHKPTLNKDGIIIIDRKKNNIAQESPFVDIPMHEIAKNLGNEIFVNSVAYGAIGSIVGAEIDCMIEIIQKNFSAKNADVIAKNIEAVKAGYMFAKDNIKEERLKIKQNKNKKTMLLNGNEAIALAAVRSGCKFYSAYPMTPSTSIMNEMAAYSGQFNIIVEQAEDEIAAVNMAIGASFAGARSMTATSGGGFCLMVEGVSLSAMTETPVVIVDAQRPAPATGFPTRTEQADLLFVLQAGHGEFAKAIFSPGTAEETFYITMRAFNLAEKYQIPVFIMTDQYLADSYRNIDMFNWDTVKVERSIIPKELSKKISGYKRYEFNENGISPRAIPSWINGVVYADSDEHTEEGHITEDASIRIKMVEKRMHKKMRGLMEEAIKPNTFNIEKAQIVLIGFGSTYGVLREICEVYPDKFGFIHFPQVWPLPADSVVKFLREKNNVFTVENNATAQLAKLIRLQTGIHIEKSILKFDGRPFDLDYLVEQLKNA